MSPSELYFRLTDVRSSESSMAPRPSRRPTLDRPSAPARPAVRDFTGGAGFTVEWDVRPVYDFLFSLSKDAGATDDLPAADRRWLTDARSSLPRDVRASVGRLFETEAAVHVAGFAVDRPELRTARAFVDALEQAGPIELVRSLVGEAWREPAVPELVERTMAGDEQAADELAKRLPDWHRKELLSALRNPARALQVVVADLRAWADRYAEIEERVAAMLERDAAGRGADRAAFIGPELIERTTGGIRWLGEPGVRRVILAPSYFSRPYNFLLAGSDWRMFGYPIADDALDVVDPLAPPQSLVRLHRALGDETRLRILKLLVHRDLYMTEIAQLLEFSKPTIKHHLAILRSAGLVTITESGAVMYYSLRTARLDDASAELKAFLLD